MTGWRILLVSPNKHAHEKPKHTCIEDIDPVADGFKRRRRRLNCHESEEPLCKRSNCTVDVTVLGRADLGRIDPERSTPSVRKDEVVG